MQFPWHLMTTTATINQPSYSTLTDGSQQASWSALVSSVPCTIQPDNTSEGVEYMRATGVRRSTCYLPLADTSGTAFTVNKSHRIVSGGVTYRVTGPARNSAGRSVMQAVSIEEDQ